MQVPENGTNGASNDKHYLKNYLKKKKKKLNILQNTLFQYPFPQSHFPDLQTKPDAQLLSCEQVPE